MSLSNPNTPSDAAKEGEPVRRWAGWRTTLYVNRHGSVVFGWEPGGESFELMPVLIPFPSCSLDSRLIYLPGSQQRSLVIALEVVQFNGRSLARVV